MSSCVVIDISTCLRFFPAAIVSAKLSYPIVEQTMDFINPSPAESSLATPFLIFFIVFNIIVIDQPIPVVIRLILANLKEILQRGELGLFLIGLGHFLQRTLAESLFGFLHGRHSFFTRTSRVWPTRWTRSYACISTLEFHLL
jgi:hypothetical protein